jgi:hypothetical protein
VLHHVEPRGGHSRVLNQNPTGILSTAEGVIDTDRPEAVMWAVANRTEITADFDDSTSRARRHQLAGDHVSRQAFADAPCVELKAALDPYETSLGVDFRPTDRCVVHLRVASVSGLTETLGELPGDFHGTYKFNGRRIDANGSALGSVDRREVARFVESSPTPFEVSNSPLGELQQLVPVSK